MPSAAVNGTELYYEITGTGPAIVLIPGLGQGINYYEYAIPHLATVGAVIALELRGVGRSARPAGPYSVELWAQDVLALLDHLGEQQVHVVGASLGACIAMAMIDQQPDRVASLALVAAFSELDYALELNWRLRMRIVAQSGMDRTIQDHVTLWNRSRGFLASAHGQRVAEDLRKGLAKNDPALYLQLLTAILDFGRVTPDTRHLPTYTAGLAKVNVPVLLVVGELDQLTPRSFSEQIIDALPPGRGELHVIPGCGHVTFLEQPEQNSRLVTEFISRTLDARTLDPQEIPA